jgi:hypothetical protein
VLLLIYNRMFGLDPNLHHLRIPAGLEITEDRSRFREAQAVLFHLPSLDRHFLRPKRGRQTWIAWSMECEQHYFRLRNSYFMRRFDLTMTYRQDADVMVSYIPGEMLDRNVPELVPNRHRHLACSFISGHADRSGRMAYLRELSARMDVHQFGRCGDREIVNDRGPASKLETCSGYRFTLAFENAIAPDYVTEKFYDPLLAGSVPVYLGAPNVSQFAPVEGCYIDASDFSGPAELADYLLALDRDDAAYNDYLNWRDRPYSASFETLLERNKAPGFERLFSLLMEPDRTRSGSG